MTDGNAAEGIAELIKMTSGPTVTATITVDQPYAQDQHETMFYKHAHGGQAKYLETPLFGLHRRYFQTLANRLFWKEGGNVAHKFGNICAKSVRNAVGSMAPIEFGDLRRSAALEVREGETVIINEPAPQPRLNDQERYAKDIMRDNGQSYR